MTHKHYPKIETPLKRARGLGTAHHGFSHWAHQRITAIANIPLMLWLVYGVVTHLKGTDYAGFTHWLAQPVNAILMICAIISTYYHASLGTQVIVEDYIHSEGKKIAKIIFLRLFFVAAAVACIFSILKIAFTAGA